MSNPAHCPAAWLFPLSPFITVPLIIILALLSHCSTTMTMAEQLMNRSFADVNEISGTASSAEVPAFGSALLELASDLLSGSGEKNTKKNHEHREDGTQNQRRRSPHHRHRQFFGSSGPLFSQEPETTASFQRVQPKTREQEELEVEDEIRAFVRVPSRDDPDPTVRFRKKTYTTMPRPFECYSCMSASYQPKWAFLKEMYFAPKAFTDACDESIHRRSPIPTVLCASFCVSMLEPSVEAGVFVGFKYIRGCGDRILRHGFNQTALQIHRFAQVDKCRQLPRAHLFNQPRQLETAITGNLQLCTCYGEHCNGSSSSAAGKLVAANSALLLAFMAALISLALSRHIA